jgi:hypothetical protein
VVGNEIRVIDPDFLCRFPFQLLAQKDDRAAEIEKHLFGTWEFAECRDMDDKKVDTIRHYAPLEARDANGKKVDSAVLAALSGWEIPAGPLTKYSPDYTYSKAFTPGNIDQGTWYFDYDEQAIIHHLYYAKPYDFAATDLIKRGQAIKDEKGEYYEVITNRVVDVTPNSLVVMERGRKYYYRKTGN